jgi:MFS family permease
MGVEAGASHRITSRELLGDAPDFRWLWASRAISNLGDAVHLVAVFWLAARASDPGLWVGAVAFALIAPGVVVGPFAGALADRVDRRRLMILSDCARILTAIAVPFAFDNAGLAAVLPLVVAHACFSSLFGAAYAALFPDAVGKSRLLVANGLNTTTAQIAMAVGAALGGILVAQSNLYTPFLVDSATFAASALLVSRLTSVTAVASHSSNGLRYKDALAEGIRFARSHHPFRRLMGIGTVATVGFAPAVVALVVLATDVLKVGAAEYGVLHGLITAGIASGGVLITRLALRDPRQKVTAIVWGYVAMAAATLALGLVTAFWAAAVFVFLRSFANSMVSVPSLTLFQELVPTEVRARAYTLMTAAIEIPRAVILPLTGLGIAVVGVRVIYFAMAVVLTATAVFVFRSRKLLGATTA